MALYLVRHAKAGDRHRWSGPDELRPLSPAGQRQAAGLVELLGRHARGPILSSPSLRCVQTVEPLARDRGLTVATIPQLAEGTSFVDVLELLAGLPDGAVLCSHGDLIPDVVDALCRRGMEVRGQPDWRKGATWVLERRDGSFVAGHALPPPKR